ncbi:MAG: sigma 54-interacting transcriptional regulator [Candidatus Omnitrophica bacterium]|nr:sigma 54-interacting transcriptional regulator [Candidatus Omnitrophota bacterium]
MTDISTIAQREAAILDSVNEGIFTVDQEWRITAFNAAAERITHISREEAIGSHCCDVFRANICEKDCALRRTMSSGKPVVNAAAHIINQQGQQIPIRISTALLKDNAGKIIGGVETFQDLTLVEQLRKEIRARYTFEDIVGRSPAMTRLFELVSLVAESNSTVLIEGPSGTGKELFAHAIHILSARRNNPFVAVNCAALPDALLESELFGHKAGAFTDAKQDKPGRFALAEGGVVFLDEIADITPAMQVRLLRVLQERVIEPLGGVNAIPINVRVIAATNKNLLQEVRAGRFRDDLYYRICVVHLNLPPLKERREDIPLLVEYLIGKFNRIQGKDIVGVSDHVMARLMEHEFPGNIRELENIIEQAFVLCRGGMIELNHLPPELRPSSSRVVEGGPPMNLAEIEKVFITEALQRNGGNRKKTAKELCIDVSTLFRKIKKLSIDIPQKDGRGRRR